MQTTLYEGLKLTEEEALALLHLAMTSPQRLDAASERALRKLATYISSNHLVNASSSFQSMELNKAGV
jgi:hypothetical protein